VLVETITREAKDIAKCQEEAARGATVAAARLVREAAELREAAERARLTEEVIRHYEAQMAESNSVERPEGCEVAEHAALDLCEPRAAAAAATGGPPVGLSGITGAGAWHHMTFERKPALGPGTRHHLAIRLYKVEPQSLPPRALEPASTSSAANPSTNLADSLADPHGVTSRIGRRLNSTSCHPSGRPNSRPSCCPSCRPR
jgi:hypothetical protein